MEEPPALLGLLLVQLARKLEVLPVLTPPVLLLLGPRRRVLEGTTHGAHRAAHDEHGSVLVDVLLRHPLVLVLGSPTP